MLRFGLKDGQELGAVGHSRDGLFLEELEVLWKAGVNIGDAS